MRVDKPVVRVRLNQREGRRKEEAGPSAPLAHHSFATIGPKRAPLGMTRFGGVGGVSGVNEVARVGAVRYK
jgi:hypothetical protein